MAAKGLQLVTMAEVAKTRKTPIGKVAEVLTKTDAMLKDIPYMQMNEGTIHKEDIRSSLPEVYYRKANQPIPYSKSTTEERTFSAAHFESKSGMDKKVAQRGGMDRVAFNRWNQAQGHIQAMAQEHARLMWYGSPEDSHLKTPGFMDIYSSLSPSEETSKQIIDAGGTGLDNSSIMLINWGEQSIFGIYPNDTTAGLKRTDHSAGGKLVQIHGTTASGQPGTFWGYEEQFEIDHGIVVKDFRQGARLCNIDISDLQGGTGADLIKNMIKLSYLINDPSNGQGVWYVNRTIEAFLHLQALDKVGAGGGLRYDNYQGEKVLMFLDMPVRRSDSLLTSEDRVV